MAGRDKQQGDGDGTLPGGRMQGWQPLPRIQPAHGWAGSRGRHAPRRSPEADGLWAGNFKGGTPLKPGDPRGQSAPSGEVTLRSNV